MLNDLIFADMKKYFAAMFALMATIAVEASAESPVHGVVVDEDRVPIAYATVAVDRDGSPVTGCVSDENGVFGLMLCDGEYDLTVSFVG